MAKQLIPTGTERNDCVQTPFELSLKVVKHFKPNGKILEACKGDGNFLKAIKKHCPNCEIDWCEILENKDFFDYRKKVDWIITNPPYSKLRSFLQHSMQLSNHVVFLTTINHLWLKARLRDVEENHFGIKEILIFDTPKSFVPSGFQIGCFHLQKDYLGDIKFSDWRKK